jgi:hypothetical protein
VLLDKGGGNAQLDEESESKLFGQSSKLQEDDNVPGVQINGEPQQTPDNPYYGLENSQEYKSPDIYQEITNHNTHYTGNIHSHHSHPGHTENPGNIYSHHSHPGHIENPGNIHSHHSHPGHTENPGNIHSHHSHPGQTENPYHSGRKPSDQCAPKHESSPQSKIQGHLVQKYFGGQSAKKPPVTGHHNNFKYTVDKYKVNPCGLSPKPSQKSQDPYSTLVERMQFSSSKKNNLQVPGSGGHGPNRTYESPRQYSQNSEQNYSHSPGGEGSKHQNTSINMESQIISRMREKLVDNLPNPIPVMIEERGKNVVLDTIDSKLNDKNIPLKLVKFIKKSGTGK